MSWINILKGGDVLVLLKGFEDEADDPYYTYYSEGVVGLFSSESKILEWLEKQGTIEPTQEQDIESILNKINMRVESFTVDMPKGRLA
jgi:hypothetical protein